MKEGNTMQQDKEKATAKKDQPSEEIKTEAAVKPQKQNTRLIVIIVICVVVCLALGLLGAKLFSILGQAASNGQITQRGTTQNDGNKIVTKEEEDIASVVDKVSPSVVSIVTKSQSNSRVYGPQEEEGAGTGIIVGKSGYILTNKHVVDGANTVGVVLADGTSYDNVKVLGTDPLNDVAFLKIDGVNNLPAADLGDSTSVRVGQKVVAIGNSLGQYQNTVTSGIISGTGRPISAQAGDSVENLTDLIQTDAAINPGNSGGPLLNLQGQVIGINTAIIEGAQGIGFSIPISATKGILKGVLAGGPVERAYVGVNFIPITADVAKHYNLPVKKGAYVYVSDSQSAVIADGPASKAGIRDKDIITKVNDIEVGDRGGVSSLVAEYAPGDVIKLTVLRGSQTMTINVTLAAYKS
jgi:serine protease Do